MNQLEYLWNLECDISMLSEKKERLECLEFSLLVNRKKEEINLYKNKVLMLNNKNQELDITIYNRESKIKELEYGIKATNYELYSGRINDLKQLELLSQQKEELELMLDKEETETLNLYESKDILEEKISIGLKKINLLKSEKEEIEDQNNNEILNLQREINYLNKKIMEEEAIIDKELLENYYKIRKRKKTAMALAKDSICLACNMKLSSGVWDDIKHSKEPILCDNCGRILYYIKEYNN